MNNICIIGLGNMGGAIFNVLRKNKFKVIGCERSDDINKKLKSCEFFILAVKPQSFTTVAESINIDLNSKVAISIMAGISVNQLKKRLKMNKVVRVMPNLPLAIGKSLSGWICSKHVTKREKEYVKILLKNFGEEIELKNENKIDYITALSGSGPAYFYYLAEILQKAAIKYGFSRKEAEKIAKNTFIGTALTLENNYMDLGFLIKKITSKGGTTEAALKFLKNKKFENIFTTAIDKAYKRAKELNK